MKTMNTPTLRFKEFSGAWEVKKLGDISSKIGSGSTPTGGAEVYQTFGIPFIRSQNVNNECLNLKDLVYISEEINNQMKGSIVKANDVLLNITGASIGRTCVVPLDFDTGNVNQHVCIIRLSEGYEPRFFHSYLSSERGQKSVLSFQVGSGREGLNFQAIRSFKIYSPTLLEQTKIANFLTTVDEKIAQLSQTAQLLTDYKKGVMQQIFSQQLRFKDDDGREFAEWEEKSLEAFLIPEFREVEKPKGLYLAIGIRSHCKGTFQRPDADPEKNAMDNLFQVKEKDLIVNITFAWEGAIAIVKKEDDGGLVSHRFPTYVFNEEISNYKFFQYVFIRPRFREQLDLISPGGAGRNRVMSKKDFLKIKCELPCVEEQTKIANFLTAIDDKINHNQTQLDAMKQYKAGLLQQMFV